jgi:ketosteroid isomerase-like protein
LKLLPVLRRGWELLQRADLLSESTAVDSRAVTVKFNEHINNRDLDGLAALMTEDHTLIDTAGHATCGRSKCLEAWRQFFTSFPDYRNIFDSLSEEDDRVVVIGRSTCSDVRLEGPALWVAKASADKLAEWRVYEDTPTNRRTLGISSSNPS